ncbi:MAG: hypothetical protein J7J44_00280 [Deltaproteobacteria bacterium]|nr:hypothetical protein [Deltaproteobacteria bacterium]
MPNKKIEKKEEKVCFVIAPIGEPESDVRKRSDQVFRHIISPAVESLGYKPIRADHISEPGIITSQVIQYVVDSPLVVADLTGRNPNVFYELAIRHAIKKPLVQLIKKGEQIPFDVAGTRTIQFDIHDLDSVEETKKELINQVKSIEEGKNEIDTPISVALDLKILKESENPEQRSLADVVEAISELRSGILSLEKKLSDPASIFPPEYLEFLSRRLTRHPIYRDYTFEIMEIIEKLLRLTKSKKFDSSEMEMLKERLMILRHRMERYLHEI